MSKMEEIKTHTCRVKCKNNVFFPSSKPWNMDIHWSSFYFSLDALTCNFLWFIWWWRRLHWWFGLLEYEKNKLELMYDKENIQKCSVQFCCSTIKIVRWFHHDMKVVSILHFKNYGANERKCSAWRQSIENELLSTSFLEFHFSTLIITLVEISAQKIWNIEHVCVFNLMPITHWNTPFVSFSNISIFEVQEWELTHFFE